MNILDDNRIAENTELLNALQYECEFRADKLQKTHPEEAEFYSLAAKQILEHNTSLNEKQI